MKTFVIVASLALFPCISYGQQSQTVQMTCRTLENGPNNYLGPDETYMNGMACKPVKVSPAAAAPSTAEASKAEESKPDVPAVPLQPVTAASMKITAGAAVFIEPMNGFGSYMLAAFQKKGVPLVPVADAEQARYVISGTSEEKKAGFAKMFVMGDVHSDDAASVQMTDRATGAIVFAYSVNKKSTWHGDQTTAEACAKHLKSAMEKMEKQ